MASNNVRFYIVSTYSKYAAIETKDALALYWIEETQQLFKGDVLYGTGAEASETAAGLLSKEDYIQLKKLIDAGPANTLTPVDGSIVIADNKIGIAISKKANNLIAVESDGIFASVDLTGIESRLTAIENAAMGGVHYKGSVATKADLPVDAAQGDLYEVLEDNSEWCYNGEQWFEYGHTVDFSPIAGAAIEVDGRKVGVKLSPVENNAISVADDGGLYVAPCDFTPVDRAVLDAIPYTYATKVEVEDAVQKAIEESRIIWEELPEIATSVVDIIAADNGTVLKMSAVTISDPVTIDKSVTLQGDLVGEPQGFNQEV